MKEAQCITVKPFISFNKVIFYHRVLLHYNGVSDIHPIKLRRAYFAYKIVRKYRL